MVIEGNLNRTEFVCCGLVLKLNSAKRLFFMNMINDEEATGEDSSFIFHVANLYF